MAGFLSKLTGGGEKEDFQEENDFEQNTDYSMEVLGEETEEISLGADLYEDEDNLFLRIFIAGVNPKELDVDVSRDMVIVSGERFDFSEQQAEHYIQKELSWGKFKKKVMLPKEVDIELVDANIKYGVLTLRLPKVDKERKVKVKL